MIVARLDGTSLCPFCHETLKAITLFKLRKLANGNLKDLLNKSPYIIYNIFYDPRQNPIVEVEVGTPVVLVNRTLLGDIASYRVLYSILENLP